MSMRTRAHKRRVGITLICVAFSLTAAIPALAAELRGLEGLGEGPVLDLSPRRGGVAFRGERRLGYAANLWLRSAVRVQEELWQGTATTTSG